MPCDATTPRLAARLLAYQLLASIKRIGAIELLRRADRVGEVAVGGFLPGALVARSVGDTIRDQYELAMNREKEVEG